MAISFLQELDAGIDAGLTATNRTKQYTSNISSGSLLLAAFSVYSANPALITVQDDKGNTWTLIDRAFESGTGRGCAVYYAFANVASVGAMPIVTFNKNGATCCLGGSVLEIAGVHADVLDTAAVNTNAVNTGPAQVTLGTTVYTDDAIMAVLGTPGTTWVTATPNSGYTDSVANSLTGVIQHKIQKRLVTAVAVYTPGWTLNNNSQWAVVGFALKGSTTLPTIVSVSSTTPRKSSTLTIAGVNFGASQGSGSVEIGGVAQTVTSWADTSVAVTVSEGTNKFGVAVDLVLTTDDDVVSNTYEGITELLPQTGWDYVDLITPDIFTAHRLTALGDLESGDQVSWNTASGLVNVSNTAVPDADTSVTSFSARAWTPGSGWGSSATQTISTDDYEPPDDTIIVGGHKPIATLELPGIFSANYRVKWSNILNGEKSAPVNLSGVTSLSVQALGTFGSEGYIGFQGSDDGVTYETLVDESEDPILFSAAGTVTSDDVKVLMRPGEPVGDGTTDLTVILVAS